MGLTNLALLNVYSPESFSELIYYKQLSLYDTVSNSGNNNGNVQYRSEISKQRRCRHKHNLCFTRIFSLWTRQQNQQTSFFMRVLPFVMHCFVL